MSIYYIVPHQVATPARPLTNWTKKTARARYCLIKDFLFHKTITRWDENLMTRMMATIGWYILSTMQVLTARFFVFVLYSFVWKGACLFVLSFLHSFVWQGVHLLVSRPTWRRLSKLRSLLFRRMRQHLRRRWRCNYFSSTDTIFFLLMQLWFTVVRHLPIPSRIHGAEAPTANNCYYSWLQLWRAKGIECNTGRICFWWQKLHLSFYYA